MNNERFVYVTYIASTPSQVWKALIDGDLTRQYWKHTNESDWKAGSKWRHVTADGTGNVRLVGSVVEVVPTKRLVLTWGETDGRGQSRPALTRRHRHRAGGRHGAHDRDAR